MRRLREIFMRRRDVALSAAAILSMWAVWLIAYAVTDNDYIIPSFTDTCADIGRLLTESAFWTAAGYSLLRTTEAFVISFALAAVLAVLAEVLPPFSRFIAPIMVFLRTLPTLAIILLLLIWTTPYAAPVIVATLVLFPMLYSQMRASLGDVGGQLKEMAKVYKFTLGQRVFKMYAPLVAPNVLAQTGAAVSLGLKVTVSAEVMAGTYRSLGSLMQNARMYVDMPRLAALTLITVFIGLVAEVAFALAYAAVVRRRGGKE